MRSKGMRGLEAREEQKHESSDNTRAEWFIESFTPRNAGGDFSCGVAL
jgi:hypothetical protein